MGVSLKRKDEPKKKSLLKRIFTARPQVTGTQLGTDAEGNVVPVTASARGAPFALSALADFATSFGAGPQAAAQQQQARAQALQQRVGEALEPAKRAFEASQIQRQINLQNLQKRLLTAGKPLATKAGIFLFSPLTEKVEPLILMKDYTSGNIEGMVATAKSALGPDTTPEELGELAVAAQAASGMSDPDQGIRHIATSAEGILGRRQQNEAAIERQNRSVEAANKRQLRGFQNQIVTEARKPVQVIDPKTLLPTIVRQGELRPGNIPGSAIGTVRDLSAAQTTLNGIKASAAQVRKFVAAFDDDSTRTALALALADTESTVGELAQGLIAKGFDDNAVNTAITLRTLREDIIGLRGFFGNNRTTLRVINLMQKTLPNPATTPNSDFALRQLDEVLRNIRTIEANPQLKAIRQSSGGDSGKATGRPTGPKGKKSLANQDPLGVK